MIIRQKFISRADLIANRNLLYVFGDNVARIGYGGQAKEMRGERNAFGIPTKWSPIEYFTDENELQQNEILQKSFEDLIIKFDGGYEGHNTFSAIVYPLDGIGTGLADLQNKSPKSWTFLCEKENWLFDRVGK